MSQNQVSTNQLMNALLVGFMEMSKMNQQLKQELADVKASQARIEAYFSSASGLDGKIESLWKATFLVLFFFFLFLPPKNNKTKLEDL